MDTKKYNEFLRYAKMMSQDDSENHHYWQGVLQGLRRGHFGDKFGTNEEHENSLNLADRLDDAGQERGKSYKDGLNTAETGTMPWES